MSLSAIATWAPAPSTARGQPTPLSADSKGQRIAYASNRSILLRSIDDPASSSQYTAHIAQTTVARFSPSGFYVASGDVSGAVRVWDCVGEGATKGEYHIISGRINDIAWDGDSQRLIAVGDGKQRFGHCITADSGNSVGEISGHSSLLNAVSIRQQRPLRAATGSDDSSIVFYHGAPFKFNTSLRGQHDGFVYGVAFSPDGGSFVSVGADKKIWLYDGKTGEVRGHIGRGEHKGSIFGVSWASDSKRFATASADKTVKLWDVEAGRAIRSWSIGDGGPNVGHQQVGVVWPAGRSDGLVISLGLNGDLSYLHEGSPTPSRTLQGHQKSITAARVTGDSTTAAPTLWTGSYEGRVCGWSVGDGSAETVRGPGHSNQIVGFAQGDESGDQMYSIAWDDSLRTIENSDKKFAQRGTSLAAQPQAIVGVGPKTVAITTANGLEVYRNGSEKIAEATTKSAPLALAATQIAGDAVSIAVSGADRIVRIYTFDGKSSTIALKKELSATSAPVTALAFSPNDEYLAAGQSSGKIVAFGTKEYKIIIDRWSSHTARVTAIAWNKDSTYAVSGGLDTNIFVWSVDSPAKRTKVIGAHKDGVNGVAWTAYDDRIISVGADAAIKLWNFLP